MQDDESVGSEWGTQRVDSRVRSWGGSTSSLLLMQRVDSAVYLTGHRAEGLAASSVLVPPCLPVIV